MRGGTRSLAIVAGVWLATAVPVRGQTLVTIGGGGSSRTDCLLVLEAPANDPPSKPKKVTCFDGDPSCDHDGIVNGVCEFQVAACANSTFDPDRCTASGVASVTVDHAVDNADDPKFDTEFQALQSRIDSRFELPNDAQDLCTAPTLIHVALQGPFPSDGGSICKRAKKEIKIVTLSTFQQGKQSKDTDKLQLTCIPGPPPPPPARTGPSTAPCDPQVIFPSGTFERIQRQIFNPNCAVSGCHVSNGDAGGQILEAGTSYAQIVNVVPNNGAAAALGWKRIDAANMSPDTSFMYHKVTGDFPDKTAFGERMPRGRGKLDQFLIDILKLWIEAGAPQTGWVPGTD
jgi:hypothetical protein